MVVAMPYNRWLVSLCLIICVLSPVFSMGQGSDVSQQSAVQISCNCTLYYLPHCPFSQKVLRYLNKIHKTIPMKNVEVDSRAKQELKRIGGKMIVPCLIVDGQAIYDCDNIIEWISQHQDLLEDNIT